MTTIKDRYNADLSDAVFKTSSYTSNNSNCVEVALLGHEVVAVRDTKNRDLGAARVSKSAWQAFVTAVASDTLTA